MTIARLRRAVLMGDPAQQDAVVAALQQLGIVHVIEQRQPGSDADICSSEQAQQALHYLQAVSRQRRPQRPEGDYVLTDIVQQILANQQQRELLSDDIELMRQHIHALQPWGDFRLPDLEALAGYRLWFYEVPLSQLQRMQETPYPWMSVSSDQRLHYVVVLAIDEPDSGTIPFQRVHTGSEPLSVVQQRLEQASIQREELQAEREALTRWIVPLTEFIANCQDREQREWVHYQIDIQGPCFVLQAWVPEATLPALQAFAQTQRLAMQVYAPESTEEPPVLLQNPPQLTTAQDIVGFFQLPGYHSWDPTPVLFASFTFFFAMILADAGYALVLGSLLVLRWRRLGQTTQGVQRRLFFATLVLAAFVYGVLCGSYFGVTPADDNPLAVLHWLDMNNFDAMMRMSVTIGVVHLLLANALQARTQPAGFRRLAPWGWNGLIAGSYGYWLATQYPWLQTPSQLVGALGVLIILLCSGERALQGWRDIGWRLLDGTKALYGISKAFGDVLSYLRLFALGLSSASLAITFNQLASDVREATGPGGLIFYALILLLGHGLNLVLGVMSGVIHGLRLNLLEFYNWGIRGEGVPFQVFRKRGVPSWTQRSSR